MDQSKDVSFLKLQNSFNGDDSLLQMVPIINRAGSTDKPCIIFPQLQQQKKILVSENVELPNEKSIELIDIDDDDEEEQEEDDDKVDNEQVEKEVAIESVEQIVDDSLMDISKNEQSSFFENANQTLDDLGNADEDKDDDDSDIEIIEVKKAVITNNKVNIDFKGDNSLIEDLELKNPITFTSIKEFPSNDNTPSCSTTTTTTTNVINSDDNDNNPNRSNILRDYFDNLNGTSFEFSVLNSQPTTSSSSQSNNDKGNNNVGNLSNEWIELNDSDDELPPASTANKLSGNCQSTPMPISKLNLLLASGNVKSIRIKKVVVKKISSAAAASNARKPLLALTKKKSLQQTEETTKSLNQRKVNQNLFETESASTKRPTVSSTVATTTSLPKPTLTIQPKDILKQIVVKLTDSVFELAKEEIRNLFVEKFIDYEIESSIRNQRISDESDDYPCVVWKCRPELQAALSRMVVEDENSYCVTLDHNSIFDQLLIVLDSSFLHDCVDQFLESIKSSDDDQQSNDDDDDSYDQNELLKFILKCCNLHNIFNVTIVIYKLEQYLRSQRTRINNSFRRRMNQLMADENGQTSKSRKTTSKSKSNSNLCDLTLEQVEMCLLDCKMRFFFGPRSGKSRFTFLNIENKDDLAQTLFRYSRSLSEQIFRLVKVRSSVDFFVQSEKSQTVDPSNDQNCRLLWIKQLQQFPSLSCTTATQIASVYPSPYHLLEALKQTSNPIRLLAEIGKNGQGKGVGNELAAKIYLFITSTDPDLVLKMSKT